jgi:LytS/YehU family sensor histidine kinase
MLQKWDHPAYSFWAATIATGFYFMAVYLNASWLIPRFYSLGKKWEYVGLSILGLGVLLMARMMAEYKILLPLHLNFYNWTLSHFSFVFITNFLAFAFGALMRVSIDYLALLGKQEEMKSRQLATELNLLKSQVQPHFLFNTLNNIYYLAYTRSERTPEVIAKLSDIMRYFVDEAPREKLPLAAEIKFLKNYIELEQIRMLHPVQVEFSIAADKSIAIPPMLLIPLVENIFKHGINKTIERNEVNMQLKLANGHLVFTTENTVHAAEAGLQSGSGLTNLDKRLAILFGNDYILHTVNDKGTFKATLQFPV